jgi:ATP-dependent 26S proteasome regulatory subunit
MLEEEVAVLRRRLQDAPRRVRVLEERLLESKNKLSQATSQNQKLAAALEETREQLALLREEVEKLTAPPNPFGVVLGINEDGTADVFTSGRKLRVSVEPAIEIKALEVGQEVLLNEASFWVAPTKNESLSWPLRSVASSFGSATTYGWIRAPDWCSRSSLDPRSRSWCSKRSPMSRTTKSAG